MSKFFIKSDQNEILKMVESAVSQSMDWYPVVVGNDGQAAVGPHGEVTYVDLPVVIEALAMDGTTQIMDATGYHVVQTRDLYFVGYLPFDSRDKVILSGSNPAVWSPIIKIDFLPEAANVSSTLVSLGKV